MFIAKRIPFRVVWSFAWRPVIFFVTYSTLICFLYLGLDWTFLAIPFVPIGIIGTAVAFYLGLKNNSSYDRLWEGRRIWGSLVNASRSWGVMVLDYITNNQAGNPLSNEAMEQVRKLLLYRQMAYLTALRVQLRQRTVWQENRDTAHALIEQIAKFKQCNLDVELSRFLTAEEITDLMKHQNPATHIIRLQSNQLKQLRAGGYLTELYHIEMERMLIEFYSQQGACERIKSFPFPRQYAFFSYIFVWLFILVLPFGLLSELAKMGDSHIWLTIPFFTAIAWVFNTMEIVGDTSENPFENSINDVPLTAICRNVEIDLREMLGESNIPGRLQAVENILM